MLTYRANNQDIANIVSAMQASLTLGIGLLIGCGNDGDEFHCQLMELVDTYNKLGASIEVLFEKSSALRIKWAFNKKYEWMIFLSDDDPFTTNHIENYVEKISDTNIDFSDVTNVTPLFYTLISKSSIEIFQPITLVDGNPLDRIKMLLCESHIGVRFYSAYRIQAIRKVFQSIDIFSPSFIDQTMCFEAAKQGKSISCDGFSTVLYDHSNWLTPLHALKSDLRGYKNPGSIFFHEVYWMREYVRSLDSMQLSADFIEFFKAFVQTKISHAISLYDFRLDYLKREELVTDVSCFGIVEELQEIYDRLSDSIVWENFKQILDFRPPSTLPIDRYLI